MDSLGDRMKTYESKLFLTRRMPVIVRIDGRAFHTYTKRANKPFDNDLIDCMVESAISVANDMQGFKVGYIQSDEASFLLTDYDHIETEAWFANNLQKIVSVSASTMTANFNSNAFSSPSLFFRMGGLATFDSRAFVIPVSDVTNYFLWRAKDWERNSLQMYARSMFSSKQLHGKNREDMFEMLKAIGKDWHTDISIDNACRYGTFICNQGDSGISPKTDILPNFESMNAFLKPFMG